MKIRLLGCTALTLLVSSSALAEGHSQKTNHGDGNHLDIERVTEILEAVNLDLPEEGNIRIIVAKDEDGEILVEKHATKDHAWIEYAGKKPHHMPMRKSRGHGANRITMSQEAGSCVLKNIKLASVDAAVRAIVSACRAIHPPAP